MPASDFTFVVCNLAGAPQGELTGASDRKVRHAFNGRRKTASCRIRIDNPLADLLTSGQALVKVYDGTTLTFTGETVTAQEASGEGAGSIALGFGDAFGRLGARLLGKTTTGYTDGTALSPVNKSTLLGNMLTAANTAGYTGIDLGTVTAGAGTGFVALAPYSYADAAMGQVINQLDGPDVEVVPLEPTAVAGGVRIAQMNVVPVLGSARANVIFEYGTGRKNIADYTRATDFGLLLNSAYNLAPAGNAGGSVVTATDSTSITTYGLREGVVSSGDLAVDALRQSLTSENVRIRKVPRVLIQIQPARDDPAAPGRIPQYGVDYFLGDTITVRVVNPVTGYVRVNAALRVYAVDWAIDDEGASLPVLSLTAD